MSDSILAAITRISAFSSFTASRTFSTYPLPVAADVSSTLQTYIIGLLVSRYRSFASCWSSGLSNVTVRQLLPSSRVSLYFMSISQSLFALLSPPAFACFCTLASLFSTVSRSFICSSRSITSLSLTGSTETVHMHDVGVVEASQHMEDGIGFPDIGKELVPETFSLACAFHKPGYVDNLHGGRGQPSWACISFQVLPASCPALS